MCHTPPKKTEVKCNLRCVFCVFFDHRADFRKSCFCIEQPPERQCVLVCTRLGGGELGDGLGSFRDGVFGELTGEHETNSGLDLTGREGGLLVVSGKLSSFARDALEDVADE